MIATESQGVFLQFLAWLAEHPAELKAHALLNGQNSWFKDRSPFQLQSCAIISTAWIYQQYLAWKRSTGAKNPSKYDNVWGEQKALTLFMRGAVLQKTESGRLKGQDTAGGKSEYFMVIKDGCDALISGITAAIAAGQGAKAQQGGRAKRPARGAAAGGPQGAGAAVAAMPGLAGRGKRPARSGAMLGPAPAAALLSPALDQENVPPLFKAASVRTRAGRACIDRTPLGEAAGTLAGAKCGAGSALQARPDVGDTPPAQPAPKRLRTTRSGEGRSSVALEQLPRKKYLLAVLAESSSSPAIAKAQRASQNGASGPN